MGYSKDGSSHKNGVKNEEFVVDILNVWIKQKGSINFFDECNVNSFELRGGTKSKDDAWGLDNNQNKIFGITIKNHKVKGGTFDFINSSNFEHLLEVGVANELKNHINELKLENKEKINHDHLPVDKIVSIAREQIKQYSNYVLENKVRDMQLKKILKKIYEDEPQLLAINNVPAKELCLLWKKDRNDLNNFMLFNNSDFFELKTKKNAKDSKTIFKNNVDTDIRLRIVLNNGVNAFLGVGKSKNQNASLTFKLQNDNVQNHLENMNALIINY